MIKIKRFFIRPRNWLIAIILLPIGYVFISFCLFLIILFIIGFVYPVTDKFFPENVYDDFLIIHKYEIIKFHREQDVWGERDYTWQIRFPKGFNSVHAIPITSDTKCLEFGTQKDTPDEYYMVSADDIVHGIINSISSFDSSPQQGIVYINSEPNTTRRVYYVPGKKPEDLFIEYMSR
jgi:hypothetical protein